MTLSPENRPACYPLLDRKTREQLAVYRIALGYAGKLIGEALAYIDLIEEELARFEREASR